MKKIAFAIVFIVAMGYTGLKATHIVGGEIFYDYLGGDSFKFTLYLYMDCINGSPTALAIDSIASIGVYRTNARTLFTSFLVDTVRTERIKGVNYNCLEPPTNVCVVRYSYVAHAKLPDIEGGYTVVFQRCCRNATILNLFDQDNTGGTYFVLIPERKTYGNNSSPRFDKLPPNFLCINSPFEFKHSATDPDGDSLVYEMCVPYHGASAQAPVPRPPDPPPYTKVVMNTGFSVSNMITANPSLIIKRQTGLLTCTPRRLGQYVVGICVKEYRGGQLLSVVLRDFQLNVINCDFDVVSAFTLPEQQCDYKVNFKNESQGAVSYKWYFGDPTTTADSSTLASPSYTYPEPGWYSVQLISYSTACSDTFNRTLYVRPDTGAFAGPDMRACSGSPVKIGPKEFFPRSKYRWTPKAYLSTDTARNPLASPPVSTIYVLRQLFDYCYAFDTMTLLVGAPKIDFTATPLPECANMTYRFENQGEGSQFKWTFGTGKPKDGSFLPNPYFTFPKNGNYTVTLTGSFNILCKDSLKQNIVVKRDTTDFAGKNSLICYGDTLQIGAAPMSNVEYAWSPPLGLSSWRKANPLAFPTKTTLYTVVRYTTYCEVFDSVKLTIDRPQPFFQLAYTFPCDGLNVKVYNRSTNCQKVLWDFGVSTSSLDTSTTFDSVSFTYPFNGQFTITLSGTSAKGCSTSMALPLSVFADTGLFAGPDTNICRGQGLVLGVDDSISLAKYRWSPADSVSGSAMARPRIKPSDTLWYVVKKIYPECTFSDSVLVGVHHPLAKFTTNYDPHCDVLDMEVVNESKRYDRIIWDFVHERIVSTRDTLYTKFPGPGSYAVYAMAYKEHCGDTQGKIIHVFVDTGAYVIPDTVVCLGESIMLGAVDTAAKASHSWVPIEGMVNSAVSNPMVSPTQTTTYTYTRSFPKCSYQASVYVRVADPKAGFDTATYPDCYGVRALFTNTSAGASKYQWVFGGKESSLEVDENQLFPYGTELSAALIAIDAHCKDTMSIGRMLVPFDSFKVIAPNIFTPNSDGLNDCFRIEIPRLPDGCRNYAISFYNRWGQEIFEVWPQGTVYCWDGTNADNGIAVNPGVYYYFIEVLGQKVHGAVQLIR
ncbi:MAG: gliding motility-associated C-terminal domain-containing protein [Bacteroidetes bacterium]|nr:gliding motility-associated C-terminal domain-containing protein [Bacteroidota bacterium]